MWLESGKPNPVRGTESLPLKESKMNDTNRTDESGESQAKSVIDLITNSGRKTNKENNPFRLMVSVFNIEKEGDFVWVSGYRLGGTKVQRNPRELVKVRLNTVDERVRDMKLFSNKSEFELRNSVKSSYETGANKRKTLFEHGRSQTKMLSFERVVFLETKNGVKHYRAHWSTGMTANQNAQFIQGMAHVRIIQEDESIGRRSTCQVEVIEAMLMGADKSGAENNNNFIAKAFDSHDPTSKMETAERTGKLMVELSSDGQRNIKTIDIYSEKHEVQVTHPNTGDTVTVRRALPYEKTLEAYITAQDYHTMLYKADPENNYKKDRAFDADINRHILGYLLGIDARNIPIVRTDLADEVIKPFVNKLYKKEITLNLFAVRIYQYGNRYRDNALANSKRLGLHKNYAVALNDTGVILPYDQASGLPATPAYAPTAVVVQRYDDGTAYVVFEGALDVKKEAFNVSSAITPESIDAVKDYAVVSIKG